MVGKMTKYVGSVRWRGFSFPWWLREFLNPMNHIRLIRDFCVRGWTGVADVDTWSFDYYVSKICVRGLTILRDDAHGWTCAMSDFVESDEDQQILWMNIITQMIDGFEAHINLSDQPYLEQYTTYGEGPFDMEFDFDSIDKIEVELREIRDFGLGLFVEFFEALWD
jgi:hypothetical protein